MRAKRFVFAGAGLAVLLGGTAVVLDQMAAGQPGRLAHSAATGQAAIQLGMASGGTAAGQGGESGAATAGSDGAATQAGEIQAAGRLVLPRAGEVLPSTGGAPPPAGIALPPASIALPRVSEVLPPVSKLPVGLPAPAPLAALVRAPLPGTASAHGKLVAGFPTDVLRFPTGTVISSTGVSSADHTLQVTADALVPSSQDSVIGHFQQILLPFEFWSEAKSTPEGRRTVQFSRGRDSLTLTTSTTVTGNTRFMLLASLHAARDQ